MTQLVSIPAHHFIGNGNTPFLIVGRVWGDDDDTATLIMADSLPEADALFVEALHESAGNTEDDRHEMIADHGSDHIITSRTLLT
ncbi:hypothetical protein ACM73L_30725 [Pseudomonas aeruginosa]|nr:MAG: hypothetical protein B7X51_00900 [Pseudomonas sp. 34-62-33]HBP4949324.1 hypothetical protein [Pseudomonas aeruginosa]